MASYVVVGTSPFADVSAVFGTYRSVAAALAAAQDVEAAGYVTEICEVMKPADIEPPTNDEGMEEDA